MSVGRPAITICVWLHPQPASKDDSYNGGEEDEDDYFVDDAQSEVSGLGLARSAVYLPSVQAMCVFAHIAP